MGLNALRLRVKPYLPAPPKAEFLFHAKTQSRKEKP